MIDQATADSIVKALSAVGRDRVLTDAECVDCCAAIMASLAHVPDEELPPDLLEVRLALGNRPPPRPAAQRQALAKVILRRSRRIEELGLLRVAVNAADIVVNMGVGPTPERDRAITAYLAAKQAVDDFAARTADTLEGDPQA